MDIMDRDKKWEHFIHGADIGIRGLGPNLASAFEMSALALTNVVTDSHKVKAKKEIYVACSAPDKEILFADWINSIIFKMETQRMLFSEFHVEIANLHLEATIKGETIRSHKHQPVVDVKGATYTELKVFKTKFFWVAQCVVDV